MTVSLNKPNTGDVGWGSDVNQNFTNIEAELPSNILTAVGDLLYPDAGGPTRLAIGSANQLLRSDGSKPDWESLSALLDAVAGSTRGSLLTRKSSWQALAPGTSGYYLKSNGSGSDLSWASSSQRDVRLFSLGTISSSGSTGSIGYTPVAAIMTWIGTSASGSHAGIGWATGTSYECSIYATSSIGYYGQIASSTVNNAHVSAWSSSGITITRNAGAGSLYRCMLYVFG